LAHLTVADDKILEGERELARKGDPLRKLRRRLARLEAALPIAEYYSGSDLKDVEFDATYSRYRFDSRLDRVEKRQSSDAEHIEHLASRVSRAENVSMALSSTTHEWLAAQSLGIDASNTKLSRFLPLRVYLSHTPRNAIEDVTRALGNLLSAFGFEISDEFPAVTGSWYKRMFAKTKDVLTQPEVTQRLEKLERAVDLRGLGQPQAEIDAKQSIAVSQLLVAVKDVPNCALQVGSIILIKETLPDQKSSIHVRTLTQSQLIFLENNQNLLRSPSDLLKQLSNYDLSTSERSEHSSRERSEPDVSGPHTRDRIRLPKPD
jgi:hypothetical protein